MSAAKETGIDIHRAADRGTFRDVCKYVEMGGDVNARDKSQVRDMYIRGAAFLLFFQPSLLLLLLCLRWGVWYPG